MYDLTLNVQLKIKQKMEFKIPEELQQTLEVSGIDVDLKDLESNHAHAQEVIKAGLIEDFQKDGVTKVEFLSVKLESDGE